MSIGWSRDWTVGEEGLNWSMKKGAWPIRMGMC